MIDNRYMYSNKYTEEFLKFASKDYRKKEKLVAKCVDRGVVLPLKKSEPGGPLMGYGGVLDENGEYVIESAQIGKGDTLDRFIGKYEYDKSIEEQSNEVVVYIGAFPYHWGHFLVDMAYRLWVFLENKEKYKIVYCSEHFEIQGVFLEFFEMLGIKSEQLFYVKKPTRFKKIIIPQAGYMACDYFTKEYYMVFQRITRNIMETGLTPYEKVYMSRGHFQDAHKKEIGEKNIEYNFRKNGFQILYMEELSLTEQIYYINHCKIAAALSGTLCHNILFAGEGTELIIINKTHIMNTHQVLIDQMMGIQVTYIDVYKEPYKHFPVSYGEGPFLLDSRRLMRYFEEHQMKFYPEGKEVVFMDRLIYTKMCLGIVAYKLFERTYYKLCRHKMIIGILRKIKKLAGR